MTEHTITTPSFQLAVWQQGSLDAQRLALVLPGKLDSKDYAHMRSHVSFLADCGYLALSFDPPGTWASGGQITDYTMANYLLAVHQLIDHFQQRPTFVLGHSRGGSLALLAAIHNPWVTHVAAVMSYPSFKPGVYPGYPDPEWQLLGFHDSRREVPGTTQYRTYRLPYQFLEEQVQYDLLPDLAKLTKPKMFVFGQRDLLVAPEVVQLGFQQAAVPKFLYHTAGGHDYRRHPDQIAQINHFLADFLTKTGL